MISSRQLGERIADARKRAKKTQAEVAAALGLARTTLVAIEKGDRRPSNAELVRLSEALSVSVHDLLRASFVRAEISARFRGPQADFGRRPEVQAAVERLRVLGARYAELERLHGLRRGVARLEALQTYRLDPEAVDPLDPRLAGEDAARAVRAMLGLGEEPALGLDERFELEAGLRIFYLERMPPSVWALLVWGDEIGACVAVNAAHPHERRRWSLAHELGHFLRDREAGDVLDDSVSTKQSGEVFPESFAREFLMPASGVQKRFADRCRAGKFTPVDLHALARAFEVSFQAMALRLEELRLLPRGSYERIVQSRLRPKDLAEQGGNVDRGAGSGPRPARPLGLPERYVTLAVAAYDQDLLSEGELAEILSTDVTTARAIYQERRSIPLEDGSQLPIDFAAGDLRTV